MKLEQQVTSLETSSRLKELGVKQASLFYWCKDPNDGQYKMECVAWEPELCPSGLFSPISAFTVAELGEMLPDWIYTSGSRFHFEKKADLGQIISSVVVGKGNNEANCRGKLLVYLLEAKLLAL